jgi:hypothetical protein
LSRFGHTDNFTALFDEEEDAKDYIFGLIFVGCLIMSWFLVWAIALIVLKCCLRKQNVGFLSGAAYRADLPAVKEKSEAPQDVQEAPINDGLVKGSKRISWPNRPMRGRIVFMVSGIFYITFSTLLVAKGITNLQSSVNTLNVSAQQIELISAEAASIIQDSLKDLKDLASTIREQITNEFQADEFCPADPSLENSALAKDVSGQANDAITLLDQLDDFASDDLATLEEGVLATVSGSLEVIETTENIDLNDWEALLILIPYLVVPSILMSACVMARFDIVYHPFLHSAIHYFFMPVFIIMNAVAFIAAGVMVVGAGANSDFCQPGGETDASPDQSVLQIMELQGYGPESQAYTIFRYYVDKCKADEDPFQFLREYLADVVENDGRLSQLKATIEADGVLDELSLYCNREFAPLDALVDQMLGVLDILRNAGERTLDLASCERIVPIYTNTFYTASCEYSLNAFTWMFACAIIVGFSGMLMVTFRAAYKPTLYNYDPRAVFESDEVVDMTMNTAPLVPEIIVMDSTDHDFHDEVEILTPTAPPDDWVYSDEKAVAVQID